MQFKVWHGSDVDFDNLDVSKTVRGLFFTDSYEQAALYGEPRQYLIEMNNPYETDFNGNLWDEGDGDYPDIDILVEDVQQMGYDGVIAYNIRGNPKAKPSTNYIIFSNANIKPIANSISEEIKLSKELEDVILKSLQTVINASRFSSGKLSKAKQNGIIQDAIRAEIERLSGVNESINNNIITVYHGTNADIEVKDLKINYESSEQIYGPALYFSLTPEGASEYGIKILEAKIDISKLDDFRFPMGREGSGTYGTFHDLLELDYDNTKENILEWIKDNPHKWLKKLGLNKKELQTAYNHASKYDDTSYLAELYCDSEERRNELWKDYLENQAGIRESTLEDGYFGIIDYTQVAIYIPDKVIL